MDSFKTHTLEIVGLARPERRREYRETRSVPVEISGFDARGRFFTERTKTLDVSESGCRFRVRAELEKDSAISVRVIQRRNGMMMDDPPVLFRVVWARHTNPGHPASGRTDPDRGEPGWTVAGAKLQPVQLWTVGFPVEPTDEDSPEDSPGIPPGEPPAA